MSSYDGLGKQVPYTPAATEQSTHAEHGAQASPLKRIVRTTTVCVAASAAALMSIEMKSGEKPGVAAAVTRYTDVVKNLLTEERPETPNEVQRKSRDEMHDLLNSDNEEIRRQEIEKLGAFDHRSFREDKIYDALAKRIYLKCLPRNSNEVDTDLQKELADVIAWHKPKVTMLWIMYVDAIDEYCEQHPITRYDGREVPLYFQDVPYIVQRKIIDEKIKIVGLDAVAQDAVKNYQAKSGSEPDCTATYNPLAP